MMVLERIVERYAVDAPLAGKTVLVCTHAKHATQTFLRTFAALGARVMFFPVPYSKDTDVIDALRADAPIHLLENDAQVVAALPQVDIIVEDGARIGKKIDENPETALRPGVFSIEQTTNGIRYYQTQHETHFKYPVVNVAESRLKLEVENTLATPESILVAFLTSGQMTLTNKQVLVLGFGAVGSGLAQLCQQHGSVVTIAEIDPLKRLLSQARGFRTIDLDGISAVLPQQDIILSCTSATAGDSIGIRQLALMKDGALVVNAGSGRGEIAAELIVPGTMTRDHATITITLERDHVLCTLEKAAATKRIRILGEAHPINLRAGNGTSNEVIDMVFSLMVLAAVRSTPTERTMHALDVTIQKEVAEFAERLLPVRHIPAYLPAESLVPDTRPYGSVIKFGLPAQHLEHFSLARAVFRPGASTEGHYHLVSEEAYFIERGSATMTLWHYTTPHYKTEYHVTQGGYLTVPRGFVHHVQVTSDVDFVSLVVASPPFSFWDQYFPL